MKGLSCSGHRTSRRTLRPVRYFLWLWMTWFLVPPIVGLSMAIAAVLEAAVGGSGDVMFSLLTEHIPAIMLIWLTGLIVIALIHHLARRLGAELRA
jgi:hypothetical protein